MAIPRVFISSTCYDLADTRDGLISFCQSFGFETILSERGDIFYHPDLHTQESCIAEVNNCQLFILIIGGRFGGNYKIDPSKSITNAEFIAAKQLRIPVFTFIKNEVLSDHLLYKKNKMKSFSEGIIYPSMEKQNYAKYIFDFIDHVRLSDVNNGFFGFSFAREIQELLRKQWAGMFFDFLSNRKLSLQLKTTNSSINQLSLMSQKIEEVVKKIYLHVDKVEAVDSLSIIDRKNKAFELMQKISSVADTKKLVIKDDIDELIQTSNLSFVNFVKRLDGFEETQLTDAHNRNTDAIVHENFTILVSFAGDLKDEEMEEYIQYKELYECYKNLSKEIKLEILSDYRK